MRRFVPWLRFPWRSRSAIARDVDSELSFHLDMRIAELCARGMSREDAMRRARDEFGDLEFTRAYCRTVDERAEREGRVTERMSGWVQDARYAIRTLRRSPGFAAVSLLTLALAIGANAAIFAVARAVLIAPLPYGSEENVVAIRESWPNDPGEKTLASPPNYVDLRARQHSFTDLAAFVGSGEMTWQSDGGEPEMLASVSVTPNVFTVLQAAALHGRTFAPDEGAAGKNRVALLSYRVWRTALGGDLSAISKPILLNGERYTLIGVMPPRFTLGRQEDVWTPDDFHDEMADAARTRKQHYAFVVGRLKPGISLTAARADLAGIATQLAAEYPDANAGRTVYADPIRTSMTGSIASALVLMQAAALIVLLIACANLANIALSRAVGRRRELAVRAALGAGRGRLVRQMLTESVLVSLAGGVLGVLLARVATNRMLALNPDLLPGAFTVNVDWRIVAFSAVLSVVTGILFGLLPAVGAARADLHDSLKEGSRSSTVGPGGERLRRTLVAAQIGLAVVLLVSAGLLLRSFAELTRVQLGFDPDHVLTARVRAAGTRYDSSTVINAFYDGLLDDLAHAPGVVAVGAARSVPTRGGATSSLRVEGEPIDETHLPDIGYLSVRGDDFKALRIPILAGRAFDATDITGPETGIINETAAKRFFPHGDAIGRRIRIGPVSNGPWITIVGVVGDIRDQSIDAPAKPTLFANHRRETWDRSMVLFVRTAGDPARLAPAIKEALRRADPALATKDVQTLNEMLSVDLAPRRFALAVCAAFAAVAFVLAAIGIYGVLSYMVSTRTRELGVRIALGATGRDVMVLVGRQGLSPALGGVVLGVGGALAAGRLLASALYGVGPRDPVTYAAVVGGVIAVALAACLVPARRAMKVDPALSMK
jgi:putative ABC transport system permease protein